MTDALFDAEEFTVATPDPATAMAALRAKLRALFSDWSDSTFARYWRAYQRLMALSAAGQADSKAVTALAIRPNGSFNVAKFDQITRDLTAMWVAGQAVPDELPGAADG